MLFSHRVFQLSDQYHCYFSQLSETFIVCCSYIDMKKKKNHRPLYHLEELTRKKAFWSKNSSIFLSGKALNMPHLHLQCFDFTLSVCVLIAEYLFSGASDNVLYSKLSWCWSFQTEEAERNHPPTFLPFLSHFSMAFDIPPLPFNIYFAVFSQHADFL